MRLIDADALIETIRTNDYLVIDFFNSKDRGMFTSGIMQAIDEQPTIEPERKKGKWLHKSKQLAALNTAWRYECSICGYHAFNGMRTDFCPNCGSDMRGEEDAEIH